MGAARSPPSWTTLIGNDPGRDTRRLAAILAADVVGYSRLVGADEEATVSRLRTVRREVSSRPIDAWPRRATL